MQNQILIETSRELKQQQQRCKENSSAECSLLNELEIQTFLAGTAQHYVYIYNYMCVCVCVCVCVCGIYIYIHVCVCKK